MAVQWARRPKRRTDCNLRGLEHEIGINDLVGLAELPGSWLLTFGQDKGMGALSSVRVEQRSADWKVLRTWQSNFDAPSQDRAGGEFLTAYSFGVDAMAATVYGARAHDFKTGASWYGTRSVLNVPPGLK